MSAPEPWDSRTLFEVADYIEDESGVARRAVLDDIEKGIAGCVETLRILAKRSAPPTLAERIAHRCVITDDTAQAVLAVVAEWVEEQECAEYDAAAYFRRALLAALRAEAGAS